MSIYDEYFRTIDMVHEKEKRLSSEFSSDVYNQVAIARTVDDAWKCAACMAKVGDSSGVTPVDLRNYIKRLVVALEGLAEGDCSYGDNCPKSARHYQCTSCLAKEALGDYK